VVDLSKLRRRTGTAPTAVPGSETAAAARRGVLRRWKRVAASLALATALGVSGWWAWRHLRPIPLFKDGDRYIVADFVNETGDDELGLALSDSPGFLSSYVLLNEVRRPLKSGACRGNARDTWRGESRLTRSDTGWRSPCIAPGGVSSAQGAHMQRARHDIDERRFPLAAGVHRLRRHTSGRVAE